VLAQITPFSHQQPSMPWAKDGSGAKRHTTSFMFRGKGEQNTWLSRHFGETLNRRLL
jgi:hypothetical protein